MASNLRVSLFIRAVDLVSAPLRGIAQGVRGVNETVGKSLGGVRTSAVAAVPPIVSVGNAVQHVGTAGASAAPAVRGASRAVLSVASAADKARGAVERMSTALKTSKDVAAGRFRLASDLRNSAEGVASFSRAALGIVGGPLQDAMEFEFAMSKVAAKSEASSSELAELTSVARRLGADTKFDAMQAAEGLELLATQGFSTKEMIATLPAVMNLAAAADTGLARAAEITAGVMRGMRLETSEAGRVVDVLSTAANKSSADVGDLGETFKFAASMGASLNVSLEQMAGITAVLANSQIGGSMAGTSQRQMLARFAAPRGPGEKWFETLGIERVDASGNLRGVVDLLGDLQKRLEGLGSAKRMEIVSSIFGVESLTAVDVLLDSVKTGALNNMIGQHMPGKASGQTSKTAATMMNNFKGATEELSGAIQDMNIELGMQLIPTIRSFAEVAKGAVNTVKGWIHDHPTLTRIVVVSTVAFGVLAAVLSGLLFTAAAVVSAYGVLAFANLALVPAVGAAAAAFVAWGVAMLATPIGWILGAIALIAAGGYLIYRNWEPISAWFQRFGGVVAFALSHIFPPIMLVASAARTLISYWEPVKAWFLDFGAGTTMVFGLTQGPIGLFTIAAAVVMEAWKPLESFFGDLWENILSSFVTSISWLTEKFVGFLEFIGLVEEEAVPEGAAGLAPRGPARPTFTSKSAPGGAGSPPARAEVGGVIRVEFDGAGRPSVKEMRSNGVELEAAYNGVAMQGT